MIGGKIALKDLCAGLYGGGMGWLIRELVIEAIPCSGDVDEVFSSKALPGWAPPGGGGGGNNPGW